MNDKVGQATPDAILGALNASGYLFEHEAAQALIDLGYHVEMSWAFNDPDENKSREIDIRAVKVPFHDDEKRIQIVVELLIECKDASSPFVFMQREKNTREKDYAAPTEYIFPIPEYDVAIDRVRTRTVPAFQFLELASSHYYYCESTKATQFAKIVRKGDKWVANHDGVYDSLILPLAKAAATGRRQIRPSSVSVSVNDFVSIRLIFPTVVLRDKLFTYDFSRPSPAVSPAKRVSFLRHIESGALKGYHMTDFVVLDDLSRHVGQDIPRFVSAIRARFVEERERNMMRKHDENEDNPFL